MKPLEGPRPWSVNLFAIAFVGLGLMALIQGLSDIEAQAIEYAGMLPRLAWDRDMTIVALSARFTIVLIPVLAVWAFANTFARLLVSLVALLGLPGLVLQIHRMVTHGIAASDGLTPTIVMYGAIALLFTPSAAGWFRYKGASEAATFE